MAAPEKKLGLVGLTSIVFGSMIGSGIFNIVQNMAAGASVGAVILSWVITAIGMILLVMTFKILADRRPDLNAGLYEYAQEDFGNYMGFNVAWGYWLCTAFANVAYAIMLNDSMGVFFPSLLNHRLEAIIFGSILIWGMYAIVINGIHTASVINIAITTLKISSLVLMVVIIILAFNLKQFEIDFWGAQSGLGGIGSQIKQTMMVTLWCFIGIEGAVMMSARAIKPSDVGRAGVIGFLLAWTLYALVSVLAYGVMSQAAMAELGNPSVAYLLREVCGDWAYYFVIISVICSLLGGWISWTLICAQVPYEAAEKEIIPKHFLRLNRRGVPNYGLLLASIIMEVFYVGVLFAESVYMATIEISGMMILPAYLFSGIYLFRATRDKGRALRLAPGTKVWPYRLIGLCCTIYCLWLIYAGGLRLMLFTSFFYLPGAYFYVRARKEHHAAGRISIKGVFRFRDRLIFVMINLCALLSLLLILTD